MHNKRTKHKLLVFFNYSLTNGLKAGGHTIYIRWKERRRQEDKSTEQQKRDMTVKKFTKFLSFLKQQMKYLNMCFRVLSYQGLSPQSTASEDLPALHANADDQVKCLNSETLNCHLQTGSFPDWAYDQSVPKYSWDSGFVRPLHSSSTNDLPPEATLALGYSR